MSFLGYADQNKKMFVSPNKNLVKIAGFLSILHPANLAATARVSPRCGNCAAPFYIVSTEYSLELSGFRYDLGVALCYQLAFSRAFS